MATKEEYLKIVDDERKFSEIREEAMRDRKRVRDENEALIRANGREWKKWVEDGKTGPRPETPQLQAEPELPSRKDHGLPVINSDDPMDMQRVYFAEEGPGGIKRGAVFPSDSHMNGKAWFPDGTEPSDLQHIADELDASGPGVPMSGSGGTVWTGHVPNDQGGYPVVMIDDGAGGVTITPDLKGWSPKR